MVHVSKLIANPFNLQKVMKCPTVAQRLVHILFRGDFTGHFSQLSLFSLKTKIESCPVYPVSSTNYTRCKHFEIYNCKNIIFGVYDIWRKEVFQQVCVDLI